jgi:hypothetical protein
VASSTTEAEYMAASHSLVEKPVRYAQLLGATARALSAVQNDM